MPHFYNLPFPSSFFSFLLLVASSPSVHPAPSASNEHIQCRYRSLSRVSCALCIIWELAESDHLEPDLTGKPAVLVVTKVILARGRGSQITCSSVFRLNSSSWSLYSTWFQSSSLYPSYRGLVARFSPGGLLTGRLGDLGYCS
jgi:hypothetical protein